jgi:hypothetical protein
MNRKKKPQKSLQNTSDWARHLTRSDWYTPELQSWQGELSLQQRVIRASYARQAETCFQEAIRLAQQQEAKLSATKIALLRCCSEIKLSPSLTDGRKNSRRFCLHTERRALWTTRKKRNWLFSDGLRLGYCPCFLFHSFPSRD